MDRFNIIITGLEWTKIMFVVILSCDNISFASVSFDDSLLQLTPKYTALQRSFDIR